MIKTFKFNNYHVGYRHVIADALRNSELYDQEETVFNLKEMPNSVEAFHRCEITEIENKDVEFYIIHFRKFGKYNLRELVPLKQQVAVSWNPGLYYKIHTGNDIFSQTGKLLELNLLTDEDIYLEIHELLCHRMSDYRLSDIYDALPFIDEKWQLKKTLRKNDITYQQHKLSYMIKRLEEKPNE